MVEKEFSSPQILATFLWVLFIDAKKHNVSVFEKIWYSVCGKETCHSSIPVNLKLLSVKLCEL